MKHYMKNFLLSVVVIALLYVFGTCVILAGQIFFTKANTANFTVGCTVHGQTMICKQ